MMNINENDLSRLSELFKVFGDSTRVKILYSLIGKEMNVTEISGALEMSQPAISQQLRILKSSGLINGRRDGKAVFYSLADEHVETILNIGMEHVQEE